MISGPGRLGGHFPGSGPSSWHRCFPFNFLLGIGDFRVWAPWAAIFRDLALPSGIDVFLLTSYEESTISGPGRLGGHFPGSGPSSWHRCFPINFLLRIVDCRPGRLGGNFPGSGPSSWHLCFPINFLLRIEDLRAWAPGRPFSGIWPFLLASMFSY